MLKSTVIHSAHASFSTFIEIATKQIAKLRSQASNQRSQLSDRNFVTSDSNYLQLVLDLLVSCNRTLLIAIAGPFQVFNCKLPNLNIRVSFVDHRRTNVFTETTIFKQTRSSFEDCRTSIRK